MTGTKKGILAILLGRGKPVDKPEEEESSDESPEGYDKEGAKAAAEELLTAIEKKDAQGVADAVKAMVTLCMAEED
jgi:hypothetical protein